MKNTESRRHDVWDAAYTAVVNELIDELNEDESLLPSVIVDDEGKVKIFSAIWDAQVALSISLDTILLHPVFDCDKTKLRARQSDYVRKLREVADTIEAGEFLSCWDKE